MSRPLSDKIRSSALTDVGLTRAENQDACALFVTRGSALVAIVADGMGGHAGGATASRIAIETLHDRLLPTNEEVNGQILTSAIQEANERIYAKAQDEFEYRGMGTTVVALLLHANGQAWVAHVGDSRAYRLHGDQFEQLTHDHSVVADLVKNGLISSAEAEVDPRRNEILRSVGGAPTVEVDLNTVSVRPGDRFLLCSDGLTGPVSVDDISNILANYEPEDATRTLVAKANEAGSPDNVTAVALQYPDPDSETDIRSTTAVPEAATASEFDSIAAEQEEQEEQRVDRARRLLLWTAVVGVFLVVTIVVALVSGSLAPDARSVVDEPPPRTLSPDSHDSPDEVSSSQRPTPAVDPINKPLPYELEPQTP